MIVALYVGAATGLLVLTYVMLEPPLRALQSTATRYALPRIRAHGERRLSKWTIVSAGLVGIAILVLLSQWSVDFGHPAPDTTAMATTRPQLAVPRSSASGLPIAFYVQSNDELDIGASVDAGPNNKPDALQPGDLVLRAPNHELVQLQADGQNAPAPAKEGDRVWLPNAGLWDLSSGHFSGIAAVFGKGRWDFDLPNVAPANPNFDFSMGDENSPIPNYSISPEDAKYTITRMTDQSGSFIRVQVTQASAFIQINGRDPVSKLDGVPLTVRAQVRAHTSAEFNLSVWDIVSDSGKVRSYTDREPATQYWTSLIEHAPVITYPSPGDYFSIGLVKPEPGDWFDVRQLSVYIGTL